MIDAGGIGPTISVDIPVWRLIARDAVARATDPARAPEGRFHHDGQIAVYVSLTPEGTGVAIRRYLSDGVARVLMPIRLRSTRVLDRRGDPALSIVWQDLRAAGASVPTWAIADQARSSGAEVLLYSSRTRPDLAHAAVFAPACLDVTGPAIPYP